MLCNAAIQTVCWTHVSFLIWHFFFYVVPDVAHVSLEKRGPCLPLDLSRSSEVTAPLSAESTFRNEYPSKDKEDIQMITYLSSKAVTEGRVATTASGKEIQYTTTEIYSCRVQTCVYSIPQRGEMLFIVFSANSKTCFSSGLIHLHILCLHWLRAAFALLTCCKERMRVWNVVSSISKIFLILLKLVKIINKVKFLLTY